MKPCRKSKARKVFDKVMFIAALPATLLQLLYKINFRVIVTSIINPDVNFWRNSEALMG